MVNPRAFAATACGLVAAAVALLSSPEGARAQAPPDQGYPERTVRVIVPTAAGGSIDTTARVIAAALAAPDVKAKLEALSMEVRSGAREDLRAVLAADMGKWGRLVKEKNIRIAQ